MNFNLEQLWYSYLNQYPYENNEEIIKEHEAFIKGIKLAVQFMLESLS